VEVKHRQIIDDEVSLLFALVCSMSFDLWVVDLDNTLYAADNGVFARMDKRMTAFICRELAMEDDEANALRVRYWRQYGTTLRGLVLHHGIDAEGFLHEVHDVAVHELLLVNVALDTALQAHKARKVIHTNGTREHAERVLQALQIEHHFHTIYDIRFNDYLPKPCATTLQILLDTEGVSAEKTLVIDDMQENLAIAKLLGAKTCWVSPHIKQLKSLDHWDYCIEKAELLHCIK